MSSCLKGHSHWSDYLIGNPVFTLTTTLWSWCALLTSQNTWTWAIAGRTVSGKLWVAKQSWWCLGIVISDRSSQFSMITTFQQKFTFSTGQSVTNNPLLFREDHDAAWLWDAYTPVTNRRQTDLKPTKFIKFGDRLVCNRYCSGRHICRGEIFQTCLNDLPPTNCRLCVGYMSAWCRFCGGAFEDTSVLIRPWYMVCRS